MISLALIALKHILMYYLFNLFFKLFIFALFSIICKLLIIFSKKSSSCEGDQTAEHLHFFCPLFTEDRRELRCTCLRWLRLSLFTENFSKPLVTPSHHIFVAWEDNVTAKHLPSILGESFGDNINSWPRPSATAIYQNYQAHLRRKSLRFVFLSYKARLWSRKHNWWLTYRHSSSSDHLSRLGAMDDKTSLKICVSGLPILIQAKKVLRQLSTCFYAQRTQGCLNVYEFTFHNSLRFLYH